MAIARLDTGATAKGGQTRARILEAALFLFKEVGYEQTTMRAVAREAAVALGNTYYYFESKEHLLLAFYERIHEEHLAACRDILASERDLKKRLVGVIRAKLRTSEPYHRFSQLLFKTAADPRSPLNPFGTDSREARDESIALFGRVVEGARAKLPADMRAELPYLLWLYHMGIVLYWIHDESEGRANSYAMLEATVDVVLKVVSLSGMPGMGSMRKKALGVLRRLRGQEAA